MGEASPTPKQIEFLRKETSGVLRDLYISTSNEVWKFCDHTHVREIANNLINEDLGVLFPAERLINKGFASVVEIIQLGAAINCNPENIEVEIREKGAIETIHDCFYKNASPEFCIYASHLGSERLCQLADPELECLFTHHLTNGDPFCRCIIKKKSIPYKEPESLGNIVSRLPRVNLSDEQVFQMRMHNLVTDWINNTLIFKILQGNEKTIEVLCSNSKIIGRIFGFSLLEASILPIRNIAAMGFIISQFGEETAMQGKITSLSPNIFVKEITECPFKNGPPEVCRQFEAFFNGMLERVNPELEFHYGRMMTAGDKVCRWVIKKK